MSRLYSVKNNFVSDNKKLFLMHQKLYFLSLISRPFLHITIFCPKWEIFGKFEKKVSKRYLNHYNMMDFFLPKNTLILIKNLIKNLRFWN